jgi:phospholipase/lecithinase/hemolysin
MADTPGKATEPTVSQIFVFGDSLSDNGNRAHRDFWIRLRHCLVQCLAGLFCRKLASAFPGGRESDGPVAVEEIAKRFSTAVEPAWKVADGTNFAVSGALVSGSNGVPSLESQIKKFLERYPEDEQIPADALYIVYIGGNDIMEASKKCIAYGEEIIGTSVTNIDLCLRQLTGRGAKIFLVPNRGDVGNTPYFVGFWTPPHRGRRATRLSLYFNIRLAEALDELEAIPKTTIVRFESFSFGKSLRANASVHGWTNLSASCLSASCNSNFDEFFFFDRFHPTAKRHELNGAALHNAVCEALERDVGTVGLA